MNTFSDKLIMTEYTYYMFTLYVYQNMLTSKKILLTSVLYSPQPRR